MNDCLDEKEAIKQHLSKPRPNFSPCGCLGTRKGEPCCPCEMQWVEQVNEKYYRIVELRSPEGISYKATELKV